MIRAAIQDKLRRDGVVLVAFEAAGAIGQTVGWAVMLGVTAGLALAIAGPIIVVDEVARSVRRAVCR